LIEVENLTKYYGQTVGAKNLNFKVDKGEILGFLGPNGAGKTTTMKMITCYLPPSEGTARVSGYDIRKDHMEVKKRIGYLPENNPLYYDMTVTEYLNFVASLKEIPTGKRESEVGKSMVRCGLSEVAYRTIGKLSKGYQQRVGIAQAILSDPQFLILDEPTLGLDPSQIIEIRNLIKNLGKDRTVILSSHILPEVSQVCSRIIVINRGVLIAVDTPENLRRKLRESAFIIVKIKETSVAGKATDILMNLDGVINVTEHPEEDITFLSVETSTDRDLRADITALLVNNDLPVCEIYSKELSLEEIFLQLVSGSEN
jgi:ABC-2 type transport system ATP-binding protein